SRSNSGGATVRPFSARFRWRFRTAASSGVRVFRCSGVQVFRCSGVQGWGVVSLLAGAWLYLPRKRAESRIQIPEHPNTGPPEHPNTRTPDRGQQKRPDETTAGPVWSTRLFPILRLNYTLRGKDTNLRAPPVAPPSRAAGAGRRPGWRRYVAPVGLE